MLLLTYTKKAFDTIQQSLLIKTQTKIKEEVNHLNITKIIYKTYPWNTMLKNKMMKQLPLKLVKR